MAGQLVGWEIRIEGGPGFLLHIFDTACNERINTDN